EPVSGTGVVATAEELHVVSDDINRLALVAVLVGPFTPLQSAVDRDPAPLGQVALAVVTLRAPHGDVEVVGRVLPILGLRIAPPAVAGHAQRADRAARSG